jgi:hypothetical protein
MNPKRKALSYTAGFLLLLLVLAFVMARPQKEAASNGDDLALTFLGVTNNPARSFRPVRLEMIQGAKGLCAVFRVSNVTSNYVLNYQGAAIELQTNGQPQTVRSKSADDCAGGSWTPGYSSLFAMQWSQEVPTNGTWRVLVRVERQQRGFRRWVNDRLHRELFKLSTYATHTVHSTEVDGSVPFVMSGSVN